MGLPVFIGSEIYRQAAFGKNHPLSIARVERVADLCRALGWLPDPMFVESPIASRDQLEWFHQTEYLDALALAARHGIADRDIRERFGIGTMENPLFDGVFERASTSVGGSIRAAELALENRVAFHPAGGTHHAWSDRARGFCYFNDPVFSVLTFLQAGMTRVLYLDLDAHHGDGVQAAFIDDPRVRTISVHEADRWPHSGQATDNGHGFALNLPIPHGCNDSEFDFVLNQGLIPAIAGFVPDAIVMTCGADACIGDPLSKMQLSNQVQWSAVKRLAAFADKVVVLGGGGYNPWTLIRYWSGLWGTLANHPIPTTLNAQAAKVFSGLECDLIDDEDINPVWTQQLADPDNPGPVRHEVVTMIEIAKAAMNPANWEITRPGVGAKLASVEGSA